MTRAERTPPETTPTEPSRISRWWRDYRLYLRLLGIAFGFVLVPFVLYRYVAETDPPTDDRIHASQVGAVLTLFAILVKVPRARRIADVFASFPALDYAAGVGAVLFFALLVVRLAWRTITWNWP